VADGAVDTGTGRRASPRISTRKATAMAKSKELTPDERFLAYYDRLRDELNTAYTYYEISKVLREIRSTRRAEFTEAPTFFTLAMNATLFMTVMSVNRFMDSHKDSLHLDAFFTFIRSNLNLFSAAAYEQRLLDRGMDEEDREHWVGLHTGITAGVVAEDKARVESLPVGNLKTWRDKKLAHIERSLVAKNVDVMKANPVTIREIDDIITALHEILDRYRVAFDGVSWVLGLPSARPQIEYVADAISFYRQARGK